MVSHPKSPSLKLSETRIGHIIKLKRAIHITESIEKSMGNPKSELLVSVSETLRNNDFAAIKALIDQVLDDSLGMAVKPSMSFHQAKISAIKEGHNSLLDVARIAFQETSEDISGIARQIAGTGCPNSSKPPYRHPTEV